MFNNVKIMLIPKREVVPKPLVGEGSNLLSMSRFIKEVSKTGVVYELLGKDHTVRGEAPKLVQEIIDEYQDVFPSDLPAGLPPLRDIQHQVDLVPMSNLPNRPHYRMSPKEHEELWR